MLEHARVGEVEDQLMTGPHRIVVRIDQAPIGMGTKELRVRADHLRFDPQAELHPEASHMGDERVEAGGPLRRIDDPVAERPPVVVAAEEPAVVEHETLDTDGGGPIGKRGEGVEVVSEVHGLPGVEDDRPLGGDMGRARSDISMERIGDPVEPRSRMGKKDRRRAMRLASVEHDFAGAEDFTGLQDTATVGQSIGPDLAVAAPSEVDGGHRAGLLGKVGRASHHHRETGGRGTPRPVLHHERAPLP